MMPIFPGSLNKMVEAKLAVRFRVETGQIEHEGETIGISPSHLILGTRSQLQTGSRLRLHIRIPIEISGSPFSEVGFSGRVLSASDLGDGKYGYHIEIGSGWTE